MSTHITSYKSHPDNDKDNPTNYHTDIHALILDKLNEKLTKLAILNLLNLVGAKFALIVQQS